MATAAHTTPEHTFGYRIEHLKTRVQPVLDFWQKINNDWVFNLSAMLAYNFLMSIFPLLLVLLAIVGFVLGSISADAQTALNNAIVGALPSGTGQAIVFGIITHLKASAGIVLVIGLVTAAYSGSRLFTTIESTFGVIFRLRPRDFIHQNIMAFGMLLLYLVLVPLIVAASVAPDAIVNLILPDKSIFRGVLVYVCGVSVGLIAACLLLGAIYIVVPNRRVNLHEVWKGTLVAAALLVLYDLLFPIYQRNFLDSSNYGSWAALAVVILVFFYYLGFILLLGAEINSWAQGQRQTSGDIPTILHEVQAHNTTRGAAGPTAGTPKEDAQHHEGSQAMNAPDKAVRHERKDHDSDIQPPKFAEAGEPGPASERPDSQGEARRTARAEEQTTGDEKAVNRSQGGDALSPRNSETPSNFAAFTRQATQDAPTHYQRQTEEDRASRKRRTFGALAVTIGAALASLLLMPRRRNTATP